MVKYINSIKIIIVLAVVSIFFAFSSSQNNAKPISEVEVSFIGDNNLFISKTKVDKLLIQNNDYIKCVSKDILDLKALENKLSSHDMIENSEVYISINGILKIDIKQRNPYARVISDSSFYIDNNGTKMPLSDNYSARVLLVHGLNDESNIDYVFKLIKTIRDDEFLNLNVTDILINKSDISLRVRNCNFEVLVGDLNNLETKIKNFKAFYQKAYRDKILNNYKKVNLQFNNQIVCTKYI
ncbi:MAG: cell division protein FtsQ/DivIB [Flavobacteriaceae bacterium]